MKQLLLALVVVLAAPLAPAQSAAPVPPLVTTTGSAQILVVPDLADLNFEVEVRKADLALARQQQAARAKKVLAALRAAGVAETDLQSSQVRIEADYTDGDQETAKVRFYRVSQQISCTLHDVKKVPDVTAEAVAAGATGVRGASLRTAALRQHRDEARAKAIRAAKEKAVALAGELGAKVGKPYTITEGADSGWPFNGGPSFNNSQVITAGLAPAGDGTLPTFAPGTISVSATVTVAFLLE
jgi:uncharacterized protein YggE